MFEEPLIKKHRMLDWPMLVAVACLMLIGVAFIFSAKPHQSFHLRQLLWYGAGIVAAVAVCVVDYRRITRYAMVGYWLSIILLLVVSFFGTTRLGAQRWIDFGLFALQPSEFAKLAFIFALGNYLSRPLEELRWRSVFWKSLGLAALPFLLILKQPDLGSALVFFPVALVMMFVAGVPVRYLFKLLAAVTILVTVVLVDVLFIPKKWQFTQLEPYQQQRLLVFFGRDFAPQDATPAEKERYRRLQREKTYNIRQAMISVGSGGLTGKGWQEGTQNTLGYLPRAVAHNDFIFSVVAEEKGFLGSMMVLFLYAVILFSGIRVADQARDRLGKCLAIGVVSLLFCHVFINIGMNIRLMPVTGIPLPLLSYGGSSVLSSLIAIGVLQNVYLYRRVY